MFKIFVVNPSFQFPGTYRFAYYLFLFFFFPSKKKSFPSFSMIPGSF